MSKIVDSLKKMIKNSFYIELSTLNYPSDIEVADRIIDYAKGNNCKLILKTQTMPIKFELENELYSATLQMGRGSYYILCTKE
ncbi:DUF4318 domain-containing protein [Latilactobacillus fuchuensis]|uniref:DUF4318 domain-containing protein n=1 Tax=Latilactobacillus fuchuensis TaxID=164393 RepID=A0A2N9DUW4_9LACO|nr:DUF4318 domain-containing protein [Latilactobacillus fuchuensis]SPC38244.1 conserved hypothetical protein [Latilactobacillus fuchuensis]